MYAKVSCLCAVSYQQNSPFWHAGDDVDDDVRTGNEWRLTAATSALPAAATAALDVVS